MGKHSAKYSSTYVDGEVSADGHEWTMGAYATDFVEKAWPLSYRGGKRIGYPSEGNYDKVARGSGGYLWDRCIEKNVSYRTYGEWVNNGGGHRDCRELEPVLEGLDEGDRAHPSADHVGDDDQRNRDRADPGGDAQQDADRQARALELRDHVQDADHRHDHHGEFAQSR